MVSNQIIFASPFVIPMTESSGLVVVNKRTYEKLFGENSLNTKRYVQISENVYQIGINTLIPDGKIGMNQIQLQDCKGPLPTLTVSSFDASKIEIIAKLTLELTSIGEGQKVLAVQRLDDIVTKILRDQILRENQSALIPLSNGFFKVRVLNSEEAQTNLEFDPFKFFKRFYGGTLINFVLEKNSNIQLLGRNIEQGVDGMSFYIDVIKNESQSLGLQVDYPGIPLSWKKAIDSKPFIDQAQIRLLLIEKKASLIIGQKVEIHYNPQITLSVTLKEVSPKTPLESPPQNFVLNKAKKWNIIASPGLTLFDSTKIPHQPEKLIFNVIEFEPNKSVFSKVKDNWVQTSTLDIPKNTLLQMRAPFVIRNSKGLFLVELDEAFPLPPLPFPFFLNGEKFKATGDTKFEFKKLSSIDLSIVEDPNIRSVKKITFIIERRNKSYKITPLFIDKELAREMVKDLMKDSFTKKATLEFNVSDVELRLKIKEMVSKNGENIESSILAQMNKTTEMEFEVEEPEFLKFSKVVTVDDQLALKTSLITLDDLDESLKEIKMAGVSKKFKEIVEATRSALGPLRKLREKMGIKGCPSLLLSGPSGVGKTTLAKHFGSFVGCPNENVHFFSAFEVKDSMMKFTQIFERSKNESIPHAIIIDDLDDLFRKDANFAGFQFILNSFLNGMDQKGYPVIVVGVTKQKDKIIESVLSKFDTQIELTLPTLEERKEILEIHTHNLAARNLLASDVDFYALSKRLQGLSGAKIERLIRKAKEYSLERIDHDNVCINMDDFLRAKNALIGPTVPPPAPASTIDVENFLLQSGLAGLSTHVKDAIRSLALSRGPLRKTLEKRGIKPVKGLLLYGPPGTGKTTLARQLGSLFGCSADRIHDYSGPEFLKKHVGESEEKIRNIFAQAKKEADELGEDSGIHLIMIDEVESILRPRGSAGSNSQLYDSMVNQFLTEMDGMKEYHNFIVVCITNRKDLIDEAALRPGRLEIHLEIGLPNKSEQKEILSLHTSDLKSLNLLSEDVDFDAIVDKMDGWSGAMIGGLVRKANSFSLTRLSDLNLSDTEIENHPAGKVTNSDFLKAVEELLTNR